MSRKPRPDHEGVFHVTARSIAEERIFRCDGDYLCGIGLLARLLEDGISCHAFCLMPTHYHVVGSFPARTLTTAIQRLNRRYAGEFNARHHRRGHVFDSPYVSVPVTSEEHFQNLAAYLAHNPGTLYAWPWSSYPGAVGVGASFSFVDDAYVRSFGSVAEMRRFVEAWRPDAYSERRMATAPPPSATRSKPFRS